MIVTFTANPSIDRSAIITQDLTRGGVHRLAQVHCQAGGKGVNVAHVVALAGHPVLAVLPCAADDPLLRALQYAGIPAQAVTVKQPVRTNLTVMEADGTTTKFNEPGSLLSSAELDRFSAALCAQAARASWFVLAGSLPPGLPQDSYVTLTRALQRSGARVAVDTSDEPLQALAARLHDVAPDILKPNAEELGQLTGVDGLDLEAAAARGDFAPVQAATAALRACGVGAVLVTLGEAGALLSCAGGDWFASPPPTTVKSTVGAGDSSLAGYLLALEAGQSPADCLRAAVAHGSAAVRLPGSGVPSPSDLHLEQVAVRHLDPAREGNKE